MLGDETLRTPSYVVLASGYEESSEAVGRMKSGDSVNESERLVVLDIGVSKLRDIKPPTYRAVVREENGLVSRVA